MEERDAYLRWAAAQRRASDETAAEEEGAPEPEGDGPESPEGPDGGVAVELSEARLAELAEGEQFLLTTATDGFGKRTSAYEYRIAGRGGQGIANIDLGRPKGSEPARVVATFPTEPDDQIMLVTDAGQLIRSPIHDVRIASRSTRGVRLFRVAEDEHVVSVARIADLENGENGENDEAEPDETVERSEATARGDDSHEV